MSTAERTRLALEKVTSGKIAAARPTTVALKDSASSQYIRYTPASTSDQGKQRIIKMSEVQEDPLEPPRFKHKKIPRAPDGPPPPVMQSPPRRVTPQEAKDWQIPPCISNWKNNKGYTIALDKRLAADGRGLQDVSIARLLISIIYLLPGSHFRSTSTIILPSSRKRCSSPIVTHERKFASELRCSKRSLKRRRLPRRRTCDCSLSVRETSELVLLRLLRLEMESHRLLEDLLS